MTGKAMSLRRRLTLSLWLALTVVGLLSAGWSYVQSRRSSNELLDYQLEEIAGFLAAQSFADPAAVLGLPHIDLNHDADDDFLITVRDAAGALRYTSHPEHPLLATGWRGLRTVSLGEQRYRMFSADRGPMQIIVAQQMEVRDEMAADAVLTALLPVGLTLPVLALIIGLVIRRQLQPLRDIAADVAQRTALAFDPLPVADLPTEVRPLVEEINRLLARLASAVENDQRFIADAAHALRTPLTALSLQADVLEGSRDAAENALRLRELRAGIRRAVQLSDHLLAIARNDSSAGPVCATIALDAALAECCALYRDAALVRGIRLRLSAQSAATVPGDERHLALLAGNLVDNALRYSPAGAEVLVSSWSAGATAVFEVIDEGRGVPEDQLETVFERFHRCADETLEGSGLGLAAVRSIAQRLGGSVRLANRRDGQGLIARVQLPAVQGLTPA